MLYWPVELGFVTVPASIPKPYNVELSKLAEVKPDTTIVPPALLPLLVAVAVPGRPGGAVMLAGVSGNVVLVFGEPAVMSKPLGKVIFILETLVGVVFNLKVTNKSFPVDALVPSRPKRTPACVSAVALAIDGNTIATTNAKATIKKLLFLCIIISFIVISYLL
jgi:hypothetical protein